MSSENATETALREQLTRYKIATAVLVTLTVGLVVALLVTTFEATDDASTATDADAAAASGTPGAGQDRASAEDVQRPAQAQQINGDYPPIPEDSVTAVGDPDAPLTMIEYADYRCPFCAKYGRETFPMIKADYIDKGLIRYEFRDLPIFGEESTQAAVAGRAAGEQGKFWEFFEQVAANAPASGHPDLPRETLMKYASAAGVEDLERFETDLDSQELFQTVAADQQEAHSAGFNSVPAFLVGRSAISGALPGDTFRQLIEYELAQLDE